MATRFVTSPIWTIVVGIQFVASLVQIDVALQLADSLFVWRLGTHPHIKIMNLGTWAWIARNLPIQQPNAQIKNLNIGNIRNQTMNYLDHELGTL